MKFLKIKDNKGFFALDGTTWKPIDEINKEHLLKLIDLALGEGFEMDKFDIESIGNQAHKIIYKNIFEKFSELSNKRTRFKDESEALFKAAIEKYSQ